jgi:hypothetical protein
LRWQAIAELDIIHAVSQSASQAAAWRADVREAEVVWTFEDDEGIPAPTNAEGQRSMPF